MRKYLKDCREKGLTFNSQFWKFQLKVYGVVFGPVMKQYNSEEVILPMEAGKWK